MGKYLSKKSVPSSPANERVTDSPKNCGPPAGTNFDVNKMRPFTIQSTIGKGAFGKVYKVTWTGSPFALKETSQPDFYKAEIELISLKKFEHPHIVQYLLGYKQRPEEEAAGDWKMMILMKFYENGSLTNYLKSMDKNKWMMYTDAMHLLSSVSQGLKYLHSKFTMESPWSVAHLDLKLENIMMQSPTHPIIANFDRSVIQQEETFKVDETVKLQGGSVLYMADEILQNKSLIGQGMDALQKCDMYSFGVMVFELIYCVHHKKVVSLFPEISKNGDQQAAISQWIEVKNKIVNPSGVKNEEKVEPMAGPSNGNGNEEPKPVSMPMKKGWANPFQLDMSGQKKAHLREFFQHTQKLIDDCCSENPENRPTALKASQMIHHQNQME